MPFIPMPLNELRIGLYIKLECSWWNHPFAKSKFKITSAKEIKTLKAIPKVKIFYDPELSDPEEDSEVKDESNSPESVPREVAEAAEEQKQDEFHV